LNHEEHEEKKDAGSKILNTNDTKKDERRTSNVQHRTLNEKNKQFTVDSKEAGDRNA
jgi:hypothetical protein